VVGAPRAGAGEAPDMIDAILISLTAAAFAATFALAALCDRI
jgi:hypothetical protein